MIKRKQKFGDKADLYTLVNLHHLNRIRIKSDGTYCGSIDVDITFVELLKLQKAVNWAIDQCLENDDDN